MLLVLEATLRIFYTFSVAAGVDHKFLTIRGTAFASGTPEYLTSYSYIYIVILYNVSYIYILYSLIFSYNIISFHIPSEMDAFNENLKQKRAPAFPGSIDSRQQVGRLQRWLDSWDTHGAH